MLALLELGAGRTTRDLITLIGGTRQSSDLPLFLYDSNQFIYEHGNGRRVTALKMMMTQLHKLSNARPIPLFSERNRLGIQCFWHRSFILAWNMDTAWMWSWGSLPTLSMNKAVRLFSFYFPNALQGTVTEMCNIFVIALCLALHRRCAPIQMQHCTSALLLGRHSRKLVRMTLKQKENVLMGLLFF